MSNLALSLCIPTNGVTEWVIPVLDSIYSQNVDEKLFEVVITDNGNNDDFKKAILNYKEKVSNLVYKKTEAKGFTNQIEAFKLAKGTFIKFVNHRMMLLEGALSYLVNFVQENEKSKPYIFFSNGSLNFGQKIQSYSSFNDFAYSLSYYLSWSGGIGLWRSDFEVLDLKENYSDLFPHLNYVFPFTNKNEYIIDDHVMQKSPKVEDTKKGRYNLFKAFAYEFMNCILYLYKNNDITLVTFNKIKNDNYSFILNLYMSFCIKKVPCSYDISDAEEYINIFYNGDCVKSDAKAHYVKNQFNKVTKLLKKL